MFYQDHIVEEIRESNDIVDIISGYVNLKPVSGNFVGLCPFHNETTPSFNVSHSKQLYHCFGCGAGGNAYSFVMAIEGLDFKEAIENLANRVNYMLPTHELQDNKTTVLKDIIYEINKCSAQFFYENMKNSEKAISYIKGRGLTATTTKKFGLGYSQDSWDSLYKHLSKTGFYDNDIEKSGLVVRNKNGGFYDRFRNRLMFPIINRRKKVIGFGARAIKRDDNPKYINSPETLVYSKSDSMYALNFVKKTMSDIIITEGYMDAIALYQAGFSNIVASLGTSFTAGHAKQLSRLGSGVILVFDNDEAGVSAANRAIEQLKQSGLNIKILTLKNAKDPDEYIRKFGAESFFEQTKNATHYIDYQIENLKKEHDLSDTASRIEFTKKATDIISHIIDPIEREAYTDNISRTSSISKDIIKVRLGETAIKANIKKPVSSPINNRGIVEAQESIVNVIANSYFVYNTLMPYISPEELSEDIYRKALQILYDIYKETDSIQPARVLNHFYNQKEQSIISKILQKDPNLDKDYLSKSLTNNIKIIKKAHIQAKFEKSLLENDPNALSIRNKSLENVENLNITSFSG